MLVVAIAVACIIAPSVLAQEPPSDGEGRTILKEQIVHKMVDGALVAEKEIVEAVFYAGDPAPANRQPNPGGPSGSAGLTKITESLQERIDASETTVPASILLEYIPMWPNGWPDPDSYPTVEQRIARNAERIAEAKLQQEPVIAFLAENNVDILEAFHEINAINADVPVSLVPALERMDAVKILDNYDVEIIAAIAESKSFTGIEQLKRLHGGSGTTIAIVDSGIDLVARSYSHDRNEGIVVHQDLDDLDNRSATHDPKVVYVEDLATGPWTEIVNGRLTARFDNVFDADDCNGHGTLVAGVASGTGEQVAAYSGYAPKATLKIYKVGNGCDGRFFSASEGIRVARQNGADVINLSFGKKVTPNGEDTLAREADMAFDMGIAVVVSSGNVDPGDDYDIAPPGSVKSPGDAHKALTVGAVSGLDGRDWEDYSKFGPTTDGRIKPDLAAPVYPMTSTHLNNTYRHGLLGTSFAAPQVAGTIASLHELYVTTGIDPEPGRMYAVMLSQATGTATDANGLRMDDRTGAGTLGARHGTMETHSSFVRFIESGGYHEVPINVPANAERLTAALWWGESHDDPHSNLDLELRRNNSVVARSASVDSVVERIVIEDPVSGQGAYRLRVAPTEIGPTMHDRVPTAWYSYTFTMPNTPPTSAPQSATVGDARTEITLSGSDADRDQLRFEITTQPSHALRPLTVQPATLTSATVVYEPNPASSATSDSFSFRISDGLDSSAERTVPVTLVRTTSAELVSVTVDRGSSQIQVGFNTRISTSLAASDFAVTATLDGGATRELAVRSVSNPSQASSTRILTMSGQIPQDAVRLTISITRDMLSDAGGRSLETGDALDITVTPAVDPGDDTEEPGTDPGTTRNVRPRAEAGPRYHVHAGDTVTLDGSGSTDPEGATLTYSWRQTDSTGHTISFPDSTAATVTFTAPDVASYTQLQFVLTVTEQGEGGLSDTDKTSVFVQPRSQSRSPDLAIPSPLDRDFHGFGTSVDAHDGTILASGKNGIWVATASASSSAPSQASLAEIRSGSFAHGGADLQPIDLEIVQDAGGTRAVIGDQTYDITGTVMLGDAATFAEAMPEDAAGPEGASGTTLVAAIDVAGDRVYLVDSATSRSIAFTYYWGYAHLVAPGSTEPRATLRGPGSLFSDYGTSVALLDADSMIVSDPRFSNDDPLAVQTGVVHVYDDVPADRVSDPGLSLASPDLGGDDKFGMVMAGISSSSAVIAGRMPEVHLYSKDGTQTRSYPNPSASASDFAATSIAPLGADRFVAAVGSSVHVFSTSSSEPVLAVAARGNTVATNAEGTRILVGGQSSGTVSLADASTGQTLLTLANPEPASGNGFGASVAFAGGKIVVGAPEDDPAGVRDAGSAYVFSAVDGSLLEAILNDRAGDEFGYNVLGTGRGAEMLIAAPGYDGAVDGEGRLFVYSGRNYAPVADAAADLEMAAPGQTVTLDGSASYDHDGDELTYSWRQTDSSGHAVELSDSTAATATFTAPDVGSPVQLSFELSVSDGTASGAPHSVDVGIVPAAAPEAADDAATVPEGGSVLIDVASNDSGTGQGEPTVEIVFVPAHGTASPMSGGLVSYEHDGSETVQDSFTYVIRSSEGGAASNTVTVAVTVEPVNDPPVLAHIGGQDAVAGSALEFAAAASDPDTDAGMLVFSLGGQVPEGAMIGASSGAFSWTPTIFQEGTFTFEVSVSDGEHTDSETVTVNVAPRPDDVPPLITQPADVIAEAIAVLSMVDIGTVSAVDETDPSPTVSNDAPEAFALGTTVVTWTATDAAGNESSVRQSVTVIDTTPPVFGPPPAPVFEADTAAGAAVEYDPPPASDIFLLGGAECSPASGSVFELGTTPVTCIASDTSGNASALAFEVTVTPPSDTTPPQITSAEFASAVLIRVGLSEPLAPEGVTAGAFSLVGTSSPISSVSYEPGAVELEITLAEPVADGTAVTVSASESAPADAAGNALAGSATATYEAPDTEPPRFVQARFNSAGDTVSIRLSEQIETEGVGTDSFTVSGTTASILRASYSSGAMTLLITLDAPVADGTTVTIGVSESAPADAAGNALSGTISATYDAPDEPPADPPQPGESYVRFSTPEAHVFNTARPFFAGSSAGTDYVRLEIDGVQVGTGTGVFYPDNPAAEEHGGWARAWKGEPLADGSHTVIARDREGAELGRVGFSVDTSTPEQLNVRFTIMEGDVVTDSTPVLHGIVRPYASFELRIDGTSFGSGILKYASGYWARLVSEEPLADGPHTIAALDLQGNTLRSVTFTVSAGPSGASDAHDARGDGAAVPFDMANSTSTLR